MPERVILADASGAGAAEAIESSVAAAELGDLVEVVGVGEAKNFGEAIRRALDLVAEVESEWLWLLHDDSPPDPAALAELLSATAASRAVDRKSVVQGKCGGGWGGGRRGDVMRESDA